MQWGKLYKARPYLTVTDFVLLVCQINSELLHLMLKLYAPMFEVGVAYGATALHFLLNFHFDASGATQHFIDF